ncbi:glycosyltransferase [Anaerobaca lacustris]|uniref:Glycosyltransferase n=1 Tax=Anaerobaca lacustris TaxID=3044600 RepID=A0AAW6U2K8_9BACT|nr:glycosyltransferase [Sedimentisphaerales bacterium M17dextr]
MDLSIVIPAYEESRKIARDIEAAAQFLKGNALAGEIIVVDDSSQDNTAEVARKVGVPAEVRLDVLRYEPHRGKGCAVRTGMTATTGRYVMFADCGLCIPYGNALQGLEMLQTDQCDIAHGSRRLIASDILRDQPWHRRLFSRTFKAVVRTLLGVPRQLSDTQCGFKMYKGDVARTLYGQCVTDGFMFDIEIILRAIRQGYRISEFPVEWACDLDSRLSVTRTPWPVLAELLELRRALSQNNPDVGQDGADPHPKASS